MIVQIKMFKKYAFIQRMIFQSLQLQYLKNMGCSESSGIVSPDEEPPSKIPKLKAKNSLSYSYLQLEETPNGTYVISPRTKMKLEVQEKEDFLSHHLTNELGLSPYASAYKIRARQIIEHYLFKDLAHKHNKEQSTSKLTEFALKAWFQRTFLDCLERAQHQYFGLDVSYEKVRERIAEQYAFQIFKMGEFINAGLAKFGDGKTKVKIPLSLIFLNSDSALYPLLTRLQEKYPLVEQNQLITYPQIKPMSQNIDLLKLINSKCHSDPKNLNIQTTFDDLKFLIDQANELFLDFKADMTQLLGKQVLADSKVKRSKNGEARTYNASAVRRVFIKWSETLIQRIPDTCILQEFIDFIRSKKDMSDKFIFKSIISETTHQKVIKCLSQLLDSIKYQVGTLEPRQQFGLFLYDLLRCKTTRKTGDQIVILLETLRNTKITSSGKYFEVFRIKNRFKSATRDILVNFRYGQYLVAEAQLCIDSPHDSIEIAKRIKFRHYLYELQRGLFGPTFQLIMQYQDFSRKDISVTLKAQGLVKKRTLKTQDELIKRAGRKCPQRHQMVAIKENIFNQTKLFELSEGSSDTFFCDFCFQKSTFHKQYHYCYYCSSFYCLNCLNIYKNTDFSKINWSCNSDELLTFICSQNDIKQVTKNNKTALIIAYREGRPACRMFLDQIVYLLSTYVSLNKTLPKVYALNLGRNSFENIKKKYQITRIPTTLLLNSQEDPQLTIVGSTFHDIEDIFEVQKRIQNNLSKGIKIKCNICNQIMANTEECKSNKDQKCQICIDTNKIQDLGDLIREFRFSTKNFFCKNGHIKCSYCSYLNSNTPSYFRDHAGRSYLSHKILLFPSFCSNFHLMQTVLQPQSFQCSKCKLIIESISDAQVGFCKNCIEYICGQCLESQSSNFRQQKVRECFNSVQIVSHFVEDQAEEAWPCGCGNLFLKVYQSKRKDNYRNFNIFKDLLMSRHQKSWACFVCNQKIQKLKLHLACFYCSYAYGINKKISHIEICMNCCVKSGLINKKINDWPKNQQIHLKCSQGHTIVYDQNRKGQQTYFECISCKNNFYPNTPRYQCRQCNFKCCKTCSIQFLIDTNQITTSKTCGSKHRLIFKRHKPTLQFCRFCQKYLQGDHFTCGQKCRFFLCIKCSQT